MIMLRETLDFDGFKMVIDDVVIFHPITCFNKTSQSTIGK